MFRFVRSREKRERAAEQWYRAIGAFTAIGQEGSFAVIRRGLGVGEPARDVYVRAEHVPAGALVGARASFLERRGGQSWMHAIDVRLLE
jgi:hypothetical protein